MTKENKIIKDLKERNGKLVNQYRDRDIRCVSLERQLEKLQQENQKYKEVIDKAIKYIEKNINQKLYTGEEIFDTYSPATDLLNILEMVE